MSKSAIIKKVAAERGIEVVDLKVANLPKLGNVPKMVERRNAMTGATFMEEEGVPFACSPRSETYWCS
jgi:hypothetical protein